MIKALQLYLLLDVAWNKDTLSKDIPVASAAS